MIGKNKVRVGATGRSPLQARIRSRSGSARLRDKPDIIGTTKIVE